MTDFLIYLSPDGGEITVNGGQPQLTDGPESAAVLSILGGNIDDPGLPGNVKKQFWANFVEADPNKRMRSQTQYLLNTLPATTANLRRLEAAVLYDTAWMKEFLGATVTATASLPSVGRVQLLVDIQIGSEVSRVTLEANWAS